MPKIHYLMTVTIDVAIEDHGEPNDILRELARDLMVHTIEHVEGMELEEVIMVTSYKEE